MKKALVTIAVVAVLMVLSGVLGWYTGYHSGGTAVHTDTTRTEVIDTINYYEPIAKDSVVVRYVSVVMPSTTCGNAQGAVAGVNGCNNASEMQGDNTVPDSAAVILPITQKKYETDDYRAYVSGFEASLDSIFVYQKTITEKVVVTQQAKQPRCGVGVITGVGYGLIHNKPDVFIGVGFYLRL